MAAHVNYYGYRGVFPRAEADGGVENDRFDGSWVGLEQRFVYAPAKVVSITLGGEGQYHFLMDQQAGDHEGLFLDDQQELLVGAGYGMLDLFFPRLRVSVGGRLDAYSTFGSSINPRLAVVGTPYAAGTTKVIVGKAFRAPSIYELYYNDGGFTQVASPDLGPEQVWSTEVQHTHQFTKTLSASLGAFASRITDLVTSVGAGSAADPIEYINSGKPLATVGVESRLRREWGQGWMAETGYSIQTAAFLNSENPQDLLSWKTSDVHQDVANVPMHLVSAKGAVPIVGKALTMGSRLTAESSRATNQELAVDGKQSSTDPFFIWDVVLSGREGPSGVSYSFGVYNVTDNRYELPLSAEFSQPSFPQPGRTFLAQVGLVL
jgi:outer membrane receptor protein involved in Fe transport